MKLMVRAANRGAAVNLQQLLTVLGEISALYLAISWVSSKVVELGQGISNSHGMVLLGELSRYFGDQSDPKFTEYFFWHPLIEPLVQRSWFHEQQWALKAREFRLKMELRLPPGRVPGHVAPSTFAAVMLNPFPWPTTREALRRVLEGNATSTMDSKQIGAALDHVCKQPTSEASDKNWADLLGQDWGKENKFSKDFLATKVDLYPWDKVWAREGSASKPDKSEVDYRDDPLRRVSEAWSENAIVPRKLRSSVIALLRDSEHDIDLFRTSMAQWYSDAMERARGRFRRIAIFWTFVVALLICLFSHISFFGILAELWKNPDKGDIAAAMKSVEQGLASPMILTLGGPPWPGFVALGGIFASALLAALGAPFWYDVFNRVSGQSKSTAKSE